MATRAAPDVPDASTATEDDAPLVAPPVVAVVVTCDPGSWLEEALGAIGASDYPNLSVLVVDAGVDDVTGRVAAVLPGAYVRRLGRNPGYAAATNEALTVVEGASHLLLCHDDVAPDVDAVRLMVEEAFRSNAGVVAPKLVAWDDPSRLLQVGLGADKSGAPTLLVEPGELDQEQHDAVRDVFVAPGGATLVRADLFAILGGFDSSMERYGEDLDLCWRAQVAGARVVVAPGARVRHLEAMSAGLRPGAVAAPGGLTPDATGRIPPTALRRVLRPVQLRHRLRAVLKNYGLFHLLRVLPQVGLLAVAEMAYGAVSGHADTSRDIGRAWLWNLRSLGDLRTARRQVRRVRALPDSEVRRFQSRGSARATAFLRGQLAAEGRRMRTGMGLADAEAVVPGGRPIRLPLLVLAAVALILGGGSRHLLSGPLAAVGELGRFPSSPMGFLHPFLSGWRSSGLGSASPAPTAFGLLGLGGALLVGGMGLLQKVVVLGMLPLGLVGAARLGRPLHSERGRLAAVVVYALVPLPYNALATGRWSALVAYGVAPWVLHRLSRATGIAPYGVERRAAVGVRTTLPREVLPLGVVLAAAATVAPSIVVAVVVLAVGLVLGGLVAGSAGRHGVAGQGIGGRAVTTAVAAAGVAIVLNLPWSLDVVRPGASWATIVGPTRGASMAPGLGSLLRFQTGPIGAAPLGWALLVAAVLPLLVGREWRLDWAVRLWVAALVCVAVAWAGGRGWLPAPLAAPDVLLAAAGAALALTVALGLVAFEVDLPGYRFGWRQAASLTAAAAVVLAAVPVAVAALDGRWHQPRVGHADLLSWMAEHRSEGGFRVLWLGDPTALPLASWPAGDGLGYATSRGGPPDGLDRWVVADPGRSATMADAVRTAAQGRTTHLGHLLAPAAVRWIVIPERAAPTSSHTPRRPVPRSLLAGLAAQTDLRQVEGDPAVHVYENAAWAPARSVLVSEAVEASHQAGLRAANAADLVGAPAALLREGAGPSFRGDVPAAGDLLLSEATSARWSLRMAGRSIRRRGAFGTVNAFSVDSPGRGRIRYSTNPGRFLALALELALWVAAAVGLVRRSRLLRPPRRASTSPAAAAIVAGWLGERVGP